MSTDQVVDANKVIEEAVARALHEQFQKESGWPVDWDDHELALQGQTRRSARAAITAHTRALKAAGMVVVPRNQVTGWVVEDDLA